MKIIPELLVDEMQKAVDFYTEFLDFTIVTKVPEEGTAFFVLLKYGESELMLYDRKHFSAEIPHFTKIKTGGSFVLCIEVGEIEKLFQKCQKKCRIIQQLHQTDYGSKEFSIVDPNGYILMMSEKNSN